MRATPSIYEARGEFQLNVDNIRLAGIGALYEQFARLKAKLEAAGWFAAERKRALPAYPRAIGIVTSPRAAALRDILTTLARRWPAARIILYPAAVQGNGAAAEIAQAIRVANARAEVDVLIVGRGGGSIEDLWAFNEEIVARAVFASVLPIVSGVGHETDFTICDFVADVRAPTPTAAAALVVPDRAALGAPRGQRSLAALDARRRACARATRPATRSRGAPAGAPRGAARQQRRARPRSWRAGSHVGARAAARDARCQRRGSHGRRCCASCARRCRRRRARATARRVAAPGRRTRSRAQPSV